jgi:hypothetical protein
MRWSVGQPSADSYDIEHSQDRTKTLRRIVQQGFYEEAMHHIAENLRLEQILADDRQAS